MRLRNVFYAQSGGVTPAINATALGLIETINKNSSNFGKIYAGNNGILGALHEELIDISTELPNKIKALMHTPGGAFGSCRYKLKSLEQNKREYERLIQVFKAHDIGYFFYNGGGDSQDTAHKVSQISTSMGYDLQVIGIPKTIDNDLPETDNCPGFGSVAKYIAVSTQEAALDVISMCSTSTKVFIFEVMGRHAGWIAAASALGKNNPTSAPHIILFPERAFDQKIFCQKVKETVEKHGFCVIVVSEGVKNKEGKFLAEAGGRDAFGHAQLGGVAPTLASIIKNELGFKYHWAVSDYLQRSARHIGSKVDIEQAYALGKAAVELALEKKTAIMPTIVRISDQPYKWTIGHTDLAIVANQEKLLPDNYITADGFGVTEAGLNYLRPLIQGEAYPPYDSSTGLPEYVVLDRKLVTKKCEEFT